MTGMRKSDLLAKMVVHGACRSALQYVAGHESNSAAVIGYECDQAAWHIWLMAREGAMRDHDIDELDYEQHEVVLRATRAAWVEWCGETLESVQEELS